MARSTRTPSYYAIIEKVFLDRYTTGALTVEFVREDITSAAEALELPRPRNLGDLIYSMRYRMKLPAAVTRTQPQGLEWIIEGAGRARYAFRLVPQGNIIPRSDLATIAVPNATPEIIRAYALDDEQALLAIVRYNRLIDIFLGLATYSLQNHLRTHVKGTGQIEIDEVYFGIDRKGCHYVIPVQAKAGNDKISIVQTRQDLAWCLQRFPHLKARAISAQFMPDRRVAMLELTAQDGRIVVAEERHYKLVAASEIDPSEVGNY